MLQVSKKMQGALVKSAGVGTMSELPDSKDPDLRRVLNQAVSQFLAEKGANYHTFQKISGTKTPVEITGLSMNGPNATPLTEADHLNGIDRKIAYSFRAKGYRMFESGKGWSEWKPGMPVLFRGLSLQRKDGKWEILHGPAKYYASR